MVKEGRNIHVRYKGVIHHFYQNSEVSDILLDIDGEPGELCERDTLRVTVHSLVLVTIRDSLGFDRFISIVNLFLCEPVGGWKVEVRVHCQHIYFLGSQVRSVVVD